MTRWLKRPRWSPYWVGAGIGVLSWATFYFMDAALGTSTTMVRAAGAVEGIVSEEQVRGNAYLSKYLVGKSAFEWQAALVVMLAVGAFLAGKLGGTLRVRAVPALWSERFGPSIAKRYVAAFLGGAILLFGARLAGGCTSGHGISGGLQLAVSSWTFVVAMFVAGIIAALGIYGTGRASHV